MTSSVGMRLVSSVLSVGTLKDYYQLDIDPQLLKGGEKKSWEFVTTFVQKHKALPKPKTLKHHVDGAILPKVVEVPSFFAEQVRQRHVSDAIGRSYKATKPHLEKASLDVHKATQILTDTLIQIQMVENRGSIIDFREIEGMVVQEYKRKKNEGDESTIRLGYPSIDKASGGVMGGDMISLVGRPAMGKTFNALFCAHYPWQHQNKSTAFVSMEMNALACGQRLAAMHTKKNLTQLKKAQLSTKDYNSMVTQLTGLKSYDAPMWLIDGNMSASVEDIWKICQQLQPEFLVIDGAYLVRHPNPRLSNYDRVGEVTRLIKHALCTDMNIPVMCSWQFNREAAKKLKTTKKMDVGLEDIGYSDVIGQVSSLVMGLLESESVETLNRRKVTILKGRDGHTGSFYINWDFINMNFSEIAPLGQPDITSEEDQGMDAGYYEQGLEID